MNDQNASIIGQKMCNNIAVSVRYVITVVQKAITRSFPIPKISEKVSTCANSGYRALSFPAHQEPGKFMIMFTGNLCICL